MRIIKDNTLIHKENSTFPIKVTCEHCNSEFELDEDDVVVGAFGLYETDNCPCCGKVIDIDNGIDLTTENLHFPQHYYSFKGGKRMTDEDIDKRVRECIKALRYSDDKNFYSTCSGTGDTFISVRRYDDDEEFSIQVCREYSEVNIPYTNDDKKKWCSV